MTTWYPQSLPPAPTVHTVYAPSGRILGLTTDTLTAGQFQSAGYLVA